MVKTNRLRLKLGLVLLALSAGFLLSFTGLVRAATQTLAVSSNVNVNAKGIGTVKHAFSFKGASNLPATANLSAFGSDIKGLSAKDQGGAKLEVTLSEDGRSISVGVPSNRQKGTDTWSFSVEYNAKVLSDFGGVDVVQIPALASNLPITSHGLRVSADLSLGFASIRGLAPSKTGVGIGQQLIDFSDKDSALERSIGVVFGHSTRATIRLKNTVKNSSWWWKEVALTLPPDTNQQTVRLTSLDPQPTNVKLDRDGNILAVYRLGPLGQKDVTAVVDITLSALTYKLDPEALIKDTDPLLIERYTKLTNNWRALGLELDINPDTAASTGVKTVFEAVVDKVRGDADIDRPLTLSDRSAPLKYADWLVGELRSRGIPARVVLGLVMSDGERVSTPRASAWAEVYINGTGWTTLDPWLAAHSGLFGASDPQHVALGLWGLEDDRPPVPIDSAEVEFSDEELPEPGEPTRTTRAVKYVILPFVSVLSVAINHGQNTIVDDVALRFGDQTQVLGSVAPNGTVLKRLLFAGPRAFSRENVNVGQTNGDQFDSWQEVTTSVNYLPLIIEGLLALLLFGGLWFWRRRGPTGKRFRPSKESLTLHDEATGGDVESENLFQPRSEMAAPPEPLAAAPPPRLVQ